MINGSKTEIRIAPATLVLVLFFTLVGYAIFKVSGIITSILTAVVLASFVRPLSMIFTRLRVPRITAIVLVYLSIFVVIGGITYLFLPVFFEEIAGVANSLPEGTLNEVFLVLGSDNATELLALLDVSSSGDLLKGIGSNLSNLSSGLINALSASAGGLVNFILIIVVSFYFAIEDRGIEKFLRAVTPVQHEPYVISIWHRVERKIGMWFQGQLLSALVLSVLTYIGLLILNIPYALVLSLLAGVFGLIPFGIVVAGIAAILIALSTVGVKAAIFVFIMYLLLQQFEEYILHPLIINKVTGVPSVVILLSLVVGLKLLGFMGLILALPAAMTAVELINDFEKRKLLKLARQAGVNVKE